MKAEDIRIGQRVKVTHAPEYVSTSDGKHKVLYKNEFITPVSSLVGQCGNVIRIEMDISKPIRLLIKFEDGRIDYLPSEALSPATPTNATSITYKDVAIGDVLITKTGPAYKVLNCESTDIVCRTLTSPSNLQFVEYNMIKQVLKPWPVKPHIGCLVRILKGAKNEWGDPIQHEVGTILNMLSDFEENHVVIVKLPDKTIEFINMKYLEPL